MSRFDNQNAVAQKALRVAPLQRYAEASAWDVQAASSPQRMLGNQALARRADAKPATMIQTKMVVGPAQDAHEQEADAVAAKVVDNIQAQRVQRQGDEADIQMKPVEVNTIRRVEEEAPEEELQEKRDPALVQRVEEEAPEEELQEKRDPALVQRVEEEAPEEELQEKRDAAGGAHGGEVGQDVESQIRSQRGGGSAIPEATRSAMESGFGADFSGVRVHQGSGADSLNRSLSAKAFTSGNDIFFRSGEYDPNSKPGQQLLAHELTHVVQQGAAQQNA